MFLRLKIFFLSSLCLNCLAGNELDAILSLETQCLPYDGSVIPDCRRLIDPDTKNPVFVEHSTNV